MAFYGMSPRIKTLFFSMVLLVSLLSIVVCIGQFVTVSKCAAYKTSSDKTSAQVFEALAGITMALAIGTAAFAGYALWTGMGQIMDPDVTRPDPMTAPSSDLMRFDFEMERKL